MRKFEITTLALLTLVIAFFPRVLAALGAPKLINFIHFPFIFFAFMFMFPIPRRSFFIKILIGVILLFGIILASAAINSAGLLNIALEFMLLSEPFMLLLIIVGRRWAPWQIKRFSYWLMIIVSIHVAFSTFQFFIMGLRLDDVKGVFLGQDAGAHVAGAVGLAAAIYYYTDRPFKSRALNGAFILACALTVLYSDAKQVLAVFLAAFLFVIFLRLTKITVFRKYMIAISIAVGLLFWASQTVFPELTHWAKIDLISTGLEKKLSVFQILASNFESISNWAFGLGPGHTVGRLGWMIPKYSGILQPLGVTQSVVTQNIFFIQESHWITNHITGSSMWSLFFTWSGVFGDLGVLGLGVCAWLWLLVWRLMGTNDLSKFYIISIIFFGCVFSWIEEPAFMLFMISLLGLRYQKLQQVIMNESLNNTRKVYLRNSNIPVSQSC